MKPIMIITAIMGALCALSMHTLPSVSLVKHSKAILVFPKTQGVDWHKLTVNQIKSFESYKPEPYYCPAGVLTVGYGHTGKYASSPMSKAKAEAILSKELDQTKRFVLSKVHVKLTDNQLYALVSFTHNTNERCLLSLINGPNRLNSGNYASVSKLMPLYNKGAGKVLGGLVRRRAAEVRIWKGCI